MKQCYCCKIELSRGEAEANRLAIEDDRGRPIKAIALCDECYSKHTMPVIDPISAVQMYAESACTVIPKTFH